MHQNPESLVIEILFACGILSGKSMTESCLEAHSLKLLLSHQDKHFNFLSI